MKELPGHKGLGWFRDGDATFVVREDFVDLQKSPAICLECPSCGSSDIITPTEAYPHFTCNPCGKDYVPDLSNLEKGVRMSWLTNLHKSELGQDWLQNKLIGKPKPTDKFIVEGLEAFGMVGIYREGLDNESS